MAEGSRQTIDARLILEAQGIPKEKVEESLRKLVEELEKQAKIEVYDKKFQETIENKEEGAFSLLVDLGVRFDDFETLMSIVLNFGPTALLINEPERIIVKAGELQNAVGDMSALLHTLAQENVLMKLQIRALLRKMKELGVLEEEKEEPDKASPSEGGG